MALPSSLYAEDTSARQTLANGTVLKWTNQVGSLYGLNANTDLSICYCNWSDPDALTIATKTLYNYYESCDASLPDLGPNESGVANNAASGWTRSEAMSPRVRGIYSGVVISNNNNGAHYWGYNPLSSGKYNTGNGDRARFLLDMDINKMIFRISFSAIKLSDLPDADDIAANPTTNHYPSPVTISLKELYDHPDWYGIVDYSLDGCMVYGEDTADHWRSTALTPSFIQYCPDYIGGYNGKHLFGEYYGNSQLSFNIPNGHITSGGGTYTGPVISHLSEAYVCMHPTEFVMKPSGSYDSIGQTAMVNLQAYYGTTTARNADIYTNCEILDLGKMMYILFPYCAVRQTVSPVYNIEYTNLKVYWRKLIKGSAMLELIASFGLYFSNDSGYDPDTDNLTPETLGDSDKIWLGEMFNDGTTSGRWITDLDSYHGPNKDGKTSNPDYTPGGGGDHPDEDSYINMGLGVPGNGLGGLTKYAILTKAEMLALVSDFNTNSQTGNQFSNHIICCYKLGVHSSLLCSKTQDKIVLFRELISGETTSDFESSANYNLVSSQEVWIDCGGFTVPRMTDTFYDFSPYSSYELFIPCCGWINLPDVVAGRTIYVYLLPDLPTCSCRGIVRIYEGNYLTSQGTTIATVNGILGSSIPFSIFENGLMKSATLSGAVQVMGGTGMVGTALATGNVGLGVSGVSTMLQGVASTYVAGNTNYTATKGGATDYSVFGDGYKAVLKINSPVLKVPDNFGHTVGYMCNKTGTLSSFSGFTICSNPHINISATSREKEEIKQLLEEGVIL